jgi:hypothetical protein
VRSVVAWVEHPKARTCLPLSDACGLRLRDGTQRQVSDLASQRMLVRVRQGHGGKDRCVPLAPRVLAWWRESWQPMRPRPGVFPARHRAAPRSPPARQKTVNATVRQSGLAKDAAMPPLRHADATPRLERGVARRVIHARLGHQNLRPTARDTPLTPNAFDVVPATLTALMADRSLCGSTGMPAVADVLRRDGTDSRDRFGEDLLPRHRRAMDALLRCRTEAVGGQLWPCDPGGPDPDVYHSGRHRRGPTGHRLDTDAWRAARRLALLPLPACPVVCTLPPERRVLVRRPQNDLDDSFRRAAAHARIQRAAAPHDVGGLLGVLCVRHPWTRTLTSHPHVPCLVPAGGGSADRPAWRPARTSSLVPVPARSTLVRGLLQALGPQERPDLTIPKSAWTKGGVVYGNPAMPGPELVLHDLGRYVPRIAWTTSRLRSTADGQVSFRSQDAQDQRGKMMT